MEKVGGGLVCTSTPGSLCRLRLSSRSQWSQLSYNTNKYQCSGKKKSLPSIVNLTEEETAEFLAASLCKVNYDLLSSVYTKSCQNMNWDQHQRYFVASGTFSVANKSQN